MNKNFDKKFDKSLGFAIHNVARLLRWSFDRQSQEIGLTRAQWSVLAHLHRGDGIQQKTLAQLMDIKPITLARHLDRLEVE
ncbi:MAG: MarR family transcriptional regulator, partial [Pseudohongiellaceae bacterium]